MKRWSNLQKQLYLILDNKINLQIHCSVYRMNKYKFTEVLDNVK